MKRIILYECDRHQAVCDDPASDFTIWHPEVPHLRVEVAWGFGHEFPPEGEVQTQEANWEEGIHSCKW